MLLSRQKGAIKRNITNPHVEIGGKDHNQENHQQSPGYFSATRIDKTEAAGNLHCPAQVDQKQCKWQKRGNNFDKYLWVSEMRDADQDKGDSIDGSNNMVYHKVSKDYHLLIIHYVEIVRPSPRAGSKQ